MSIVRISLKFGKLLDSLEDPDSLNDLELEWQDIIKGVNEIQEKIKKFEVKLDKIIQEKNKNVD